MKVNFTHVLVVGLTLLAVAMAVGLLNAWEARSEWKERAERFEAERDSAQNQTDFWQDSASILETRVAEADSATQRAEIAAQNARETADSALRVLEMEAEDAEIASDSLETALIAAIEADLPADTTKFIANQLFSAQQRQTVALEGQIEEKDGVITAQEGLITALRVENAEKDALLVVKDSTITSKTREIRIRDRQIAELQEELKPGFFDLSTPDILRDIALFVLGRASAEVF